MRRLLLILTLLLLSGYSYGQDSIRALVSHDSIRIGEQLEYRVLIPKSMWTGTTLPILSDSLDRYTVVFPSIVDTLNEYIQVSTTLTAFDSGLWVIPPYQYDDHSSPSLSIYIATVPVDTSRPYRDIYGLKEVEKPKSSYSWLWWLLVIPILWLIYRGLRSLHPKTQTTRVKVQTPYEIAEAKLDKLRKSEMWKDPNQVKEFYVELTDIMREYFQDQFGVHAMESTSTELLERIKKYSPINQRRSDVQWLLEQADLAKFAKTRPLKEVNENAIFRLDSILRWTRPRTEKLDEIRSQYVG